MVGGPVSRGTFGMKRAAKILFQVMLATGGGGGGESEGKINAIRTTFFPKAKGILPLERGPFRVF
jgi:hypothetical protein